MRGPHPSAPLTQPWPSHISGSVCLWRQITMWIHCLQTSPTTLSHEPLGNCDLYCAHYRCGQPRNYQQGPASWKLKKKEKRNEQGKPETRPRPVRTLSLRFSTECWYCGRSQTTLQHALPESEQEPRSHSAKWIGVVHIMGCSSKSTSMWGRNL